MFSGIIQNVSPVLQAARRGALLRVRVRMPARWSLRKGQSVSVDGVCSTVTETGRDWFEVAYMPETLKKTTARAFAKGRRVNVERSLAYGDALDGHFVQGHVEGTATVAKVTGEGKSRRLMLSIPNALVRFILTKGSVAINGVSLTVAKKSAAGVEVALIPLTLSHTNLGALKEKDAVNVETDILARYGTALTAGGKVARALAGSLKMHHKKKRI